MDYGQAFFLYIAATKLLDALTVLGVWYGVWFLRFHTKLFPITKGIPQFDEYERISLPLMLVFLAVFHVVGAYRRDRVHFGFRSLKKVLQGCVLGLLIFISTLYFKGDADFSRIYLIIFLVVLIPSMIFERALIHLAWTLVEKKLVRKLRVLLVGGGELLEMYVQQIRKRDPYPVEWLGQLGSKNLGQKLRVAYLGTEERLPQLVAQGNVDMVIVSYPPDHMTRYSHILESISNELVTIKVLPDFGRYNTFAYVAEQECGVPLLHFNQLPAGNSDRAVKRMFDIAGSLIFLVLFSPLFAFIAAVIKLTSRGPVFYAQERIGADGTLFTLYKFRSMRTDAEATTGAVWAVEDDPRTTPIGRWLRKTSLDEIPQFFNVLKGDMSLVGPRPERPFFVDQFKREIPKYMLRHRMKSGITGWAQVNGWRGNTSIDERIKHDLFYIGHWSHYFDLKIMVLTLIKGFVNRHAY